MSFRKIDIDALEEDAFGQDELDAQEIGEVRPAHEIEAAVASRAQEVRTLLQRGNASGALSASLQDPPYGRSLDAAKARNTQTVMEVLSSIKLVEVGQTVKGLSLDEQDVLMKYLYAGMAAPEQFNTGVLLAWHEKHASLINNCYPARPDEKGPKSSELSYLVFYATSKPAKLTKVGVFIERRVVRDYKKKRLSDVHCSLEILKALLNNSKAHLNIFAKNIVSVLDTLLLDISDLDIVRHCQNVFSCFCSAHDGSTLGVDTEFRALYDRVVARFAGIATIKGTDSSNRYRLIGLRALEAVVSSSALYACEPKAQLALVLPAILDCLIDSKNGISIALEGADETTSVRRSLSIHAAVHPDNTVTDDDVTAEAGRCLRALLKSQNGSNVRMVLGPIFAYLDEHSRWWPSTFGVGIVKAIVSSILPQYRYMVVNEITSRIDSIEATTPDHTLRLQKRATLIEALGAILTSPISLVGMPVLEVLQSLLTSLIRSLSSSESMVKNGGSSQHLALESTIQEGLERCVGGLATHIYYSNQVPHIISHIASKLSFKLGASPKPSSIEGVSVIGYRTALLECLLAVIKTSRDSGRQEASFHTAELSSDLLTPCLGLLLDDSQEVRVSFAQALVSFLVAEDESHHVSTGATLMTSPIPSTSGDLYFRAAAHQVLYTYATSSSLTPQDLVAVYGILKALLAHFQDDEFMRVVPVLFSIQEWCLQEPVVKESAATEATRKRAVAAAIVSYFQMATTKYAMAGPQDYLENIRSSRISESQWVALEYGTLDESLAQASEKEWEAPSEPLEPVLSHPLARDHLVTLLTTVSDRFRAGADRFGLTFKPETDLNLLAGQASGRDFSSGLFVQSSGTLNGLPASLNHKSERSMDSRIRVSRHLEDWALPKLIPQPSTSSSDASVSEEVAELTVAKEESLLGREQFPMDDSLTYRKIGVDSLKAALAAAHNAAEVTSDAGSSSAGSESRNGTLSAAQKFYPLSVHAQTLRKHSASASAMSTTSSLAASRPDLADLLNTIQ
ncbi:plasma membrane localization protein, partial [Lunasporangiospora selenospora]